MLQKLHPLESSSNHTDYESGETQGSGRCMAHLGPDQAPQIVG
jgi:hypothetical protein